MSEQLSVANLIKEFQACGDVKQEYFQVENEQIQIFYCEGMSDEGLLFQTILPELRQQLKDSLTKENHQQTNSTDNGQKQNEQKPSQSKEQNVDQPSSNQTENERNNQTQQNQSDKADTTQTNKQSDEQQSENKQHVKENIQTSNETNSSSDQKSSQKGEADVEQTNDHQQAQHTSAGKDNQLPLASNHKAESNSLNIEQKEQKEPTSSTEQKHSLNDNGTMPSQEQNQIQDQTQNQQNNQNRNQAQKNSQAKDQNQTSNQQPSIQIQNFMLPGLKEISSLNDALEQVFRGNCVIAFKESQQFWVVQTANQPNRQPEETSLEVSLKGPRDNFVEDTTTNIALVRKRLPTNSLVVEKMVVGKRSKTNVAILYFQDIADQKILQEMKQQIQSINTDVVFSGELLFEDVNKKMFVVPNYEYTGRPDFVVQALVRGRYVVFVEGSAYALITPVNFWFLIKSGEDNEYPVAYSSFQRMLRVIGLLIGLLLPAFWLALTTFHQNQLPFQLIATVVQSNTGLPFPSAVEMMLMLLFFELFRETGLRMPSVVGGTISVVGGIIIGDAAIRAGITSPAIVVVIALSIIATFTLVNQAVVGLVSLCRIVFILITAILGLFGFFCSLYLTILLLANIKVFGVPYLNVAADLSVKNTLKTFFRLNHEQYKKRPEALKTKDSTRGNNQKKGS